MYQIHFGSNASPKPTTVGSVRIQKSYIQWVQLNDPGVFNMETDSSHMFGVIGRLSVEHSCFGLYGH